MRIINLFTFFLVIIGLKIHAQPYLNISSQLNFGSAYSLEYPTKIIVVGDSLYVVGTITGDGGSITGVVPAGYNGVLLKTDANLNPARHKVYGGDAMDGFTDILLLPDGNLLIVGYTYDEVGTGDVANPSHGSADLWLLKISPLGQVIWQHTYGGDSYEGIISKAVVLANGNMIIATSSASGASGNKTEPLRGMQDFWVLCIDGEGDILWDKTIGSENIDSFSCLSTDSNSNTFVGGRSLTGASADKTSFGYGSYDFWLLKLDMNGNILWELAYGGSDQDGMYGVIALGDYLYLLGYSRSPISGVKTQASLQSGVNDTWLIKANAQNGSIIWDKVYGGTNSDVGRILQLVHGNAIAVICESYSNASATKSENGYGLRDYWLFVVDENGDVITDRTIGGSDDDDPHSMIYANNAFYIAGRSRSQASGVKTSNTWNGGDDFWMLKLETNVGIPNESNIQTAVELFPNPVSETLFFTLEHNTYNARAEVLDMTGKTVINSMPAIDGRYGVAVSHLTNGTYFLKISWQDHVAVKPFVKY